MNSPSVLRSIRFYGQCGIDQKYSQILIKFGQRGRNFANSGYTGWRQTEDRCHVPNSVLTDRLLKPINITIVSEHGPTLLLDISWSNLGNELEH